VIAPGIIIGVGGNIGSEREIVDRFRTAREAIAALGDVRSAPLYRSQPMGPAQPAFLNTALRLRAPDDAAPRPEQLLAILLEIERLLGRDREREARWGPRTIDLDVLLWGSLAIRTPELEIPHPRLAERRFALAPLVDLAGDVDLPGIGSAHAALARVRDQVVDAIAEHW
jgi:2-amino-4-hydroxy-6-hydroxymethyldihydropteridine diphosphokinase